MDATKIIEILKDPLHIAKLSEILSNGSRLEIYIVKEELKAVEVKRSLVKLDI